MRGREKEGFCRGWRLGRERSLVGEPRWAVQMPEGEAEGKQRLQSFPGSGGVAMQMIGPRGGTSVGGWVRAGCTSECVAGRGRRGSGGGTCPRGGPEWRRGCPPGARRARAPERVCAGARAAAIPGGGSERVGPRGAARSSAPYVRESGRPAARRGGQSMCSGRGLLQPPEEERMTAARRARGSRRRARTEGMQRTVCVRL